MRGQTLAPDTVSFRFQSDIIVTVDKPAAGKKKFSLVILYALPNGNSTAQTFGKKLQPGDDWHFDIQHTGAQTAFIRKELNSKNINVIYLETTQKSWPAWKAAHQSDYRTRIRQLTDTLQRIIPDPAAAWYLNGHSGGGRFIFSFLDAYDSIPTFIQRISFLDSDYGYEVYYLDKLVPWLRQHPSHHLNVFAYNDSVALYQGKRVVSDTGGTWYRSRKMMRELSCCNTFASTRDDSIRAWRSTDGQVQFFFKPNPDQGIYHTQQVERNGFIHSVLCATRRESKRYRYYGPRAYSSFIR